MKDNPVEKSGNPLSVSAVSRSIESFQIAQPETPQNFEDHSQLKEIPKFTSELKNKGIIKPRTSRKEGMKRDFQGFQASQAETVFDSNGAFGSKVQKTEEGRQ